MANPPRRAPFVDDGDDPSWLPVFGDEHRPPVDIRNAHERLGEDHQGHRFVIGHVGQLALSYPYLQRRAPVVAGDGDKLDHELTLAELLTCPI